jgi:Fic family protein
MASHKHNIRSKLPKIYSQDLINSLFRHPYTKIEYIKSDLGVTRKTASRYLEQLCSINILHKNRLGKENYYFNDDLIALLSNVTNLKKEKEDNPQIITVKI